MQKYAPADRSLSTYSELANNENENVFVKASRPRLVRRLCRNLAGSYNEKCNKQHL